MTLSDALGSRSDGYWELLATAVGNPDALAQTRKGLAREALERGAFGEGVAPSIVRQRVEALAAWNRETLVELAMGWIEPSKIDRNPLWTAAWGASMRHLHSANIFGSEYFSVPELASERAIVFSTRRPAVSWRELARRWQSSSLPFDAVRETAQALLSERTISRDDVITAPVSMLRVLRGRANLLEPDAINAIETRARVALERPNFDAAVLFDTLREPEIRNEQLLLFGRERLETHLGTIADPREILELAYVLLGSWRLP
jgi:hypothetical protein